jgi:hypothetical protein
VAQWQRIGLGNRKIVGLNPARLVEKLRHWPNRAKASQVRLAKDWLVLGPQECTPTIRDGDLGLIWGLNKDIRRQREKDHK